MQPSKPKPAAPTIRSVVPWNKGDFVGPKPPPKPKQVWSIRLTLQREGRIHDLALFDLAVYNKLRGCDLVQLRIGQLVINAAGRHRATIVQQKTEPQFDELEPKLTRHGYNVRILSEQFNAKPAEIKRLLRGKLDEVVPPGWTVWRPS